MSTGKATPPEPTRASGESGGHRYDPGQRLTAARIQHANPHWLLLWGTHSRRYFAFPMFTVPPGTIVTASEPNRLVTRMRQAEAPRPSSRACLPARRRLHSRWLGGELVVDAAGGVGQGLA